MIRQLSLDRVAHVAFMYQATIIEREQKWEYMVFSFFSIIISSLSRDRDKRYNQRITDLPTVGSVLVSARW